MARQEPYVKITEVIKSAPNLLSITGTSNIGCVVVSEVGPKLAYVQGPEEFLSLYTRTGEIPRNAHISLINAYYLSFSAGLVIARSMNTEVVSGVAVTDTEVVTGLKFKDGKLLSNYVTLDPGITEPEGDWAMIINDVVEYHGYSIDEVMAMDEYSSYSSFELCESVNDLAYNITKWNSFSARVETEDIGEEGEPQSVTKIRISYDDTVSVELSEVYTGCTPSLDSPQLEDYMTDKDSWLFTVNCDTPQASDTYGIKVEKYGVNSGNGRNQFYLYLGPDGELDNTNRFLVSLYTDSVDSSNSSNYIDQLNTMDLGYNIVVYKSDVDLSPEATLEGKYGNSGLVLSECGETTSLNSAVNVLEDQVEYDIEYLAPLGITDPTFVNRLVTAGEANYWFTAADIPYNTTNPSQIRKDGDKYSQTSNLIVLGLFDKNSSFLGWNCYIAPSTLYYERIMTNKLSNAEFAPVFEANYGTVATTNPVASVGKSDRENLLGGNPINLIIYNQRNSIYYFNNNLTHQNVDNIMSEEQNRRLVNKIKKDLVRLMAQFKGLYNTSKTRSDVSSIIDSYFVNNIMGIQFAPNEYQIICDETNNSDEIIRSNKLAVTVRVRLYNSIKYIEILNEVYPLGVDFKS